jgi:hypothetical protein
VVLISTVLHACGFIHREGFYFVDRFLRSALPGDRTAAGGEADTNVADE